MGFFDKLLGKGQLPAAPAPQATGDLPRAQLDAAAEHLAAGRKAEAVAAYEAMLAAGPASGELLAAISADLGRHSALEDMLTLLTPVYDPAAHGAGAGLNLIQACLHRADPEGAQMWIDVLAALDRPDLADRLAGFARAAAELRNATIVEAPPVAVPRMPEAAVNLVSISRPLWSYALPGSEALLPGKPGRSRAIAVLTFAATGPEGALDPAHAANVWARMFPFALAEALAFAPTWETKAIVGITEGNKLFTPPRAFGLEQVRGLLRGGKDAADYAISGAVVATGDTIEVRAEVFDVQRDRSMKTFADTRALAEADGAFAAVFAQLRQYLEATAVLPGGLAYAPPASMTERFAALDHALAFFLVDKAVVQPEFLGDGAARLAALDAHAAASPGDPIAPSLAQGAREILGRLQSG